MSCKVDVQKAILDSFIEDAFLGRYTYTRIANNVIQINGTVDNSKTKALSNAQARKIAAERIKYVVQKSNGHVLGSSQQMSEYDPIYIKFDVNPAYVDHIYNGLPEVQRTDPSNVFEQEGNQYFLNGDVYPSYEDAIADEDNYDYDSEPFENNFQSEDLENSEKLVSLNNKFNELLEKGIITQICS